MSQKRKRRAKFEKESPRVVEPKPKKESWVDRAIREYERYPDANVRNPDAVRHNPCDNEK